MIETKIHPDNVLEALLAKGRRSTIRCNLNRLHEICRRQHSIGNKDFSRSTIGRMAEAEGIFQARILYNKTSADYTELIEAWGAYVGPFTQKKRHKNKASDEFLLRIEDPAIRSIMQSVIAERDRLKGELNILKSTTVYTIDKRPIAPSPHSSSATKHPTALEARERLNQVEREALELAVSRQYLESRGLREGKDGEIYDQSDFMLFEPGFTDAIRIVLGEFISANKS